MAGVDAAEPVTVSAPGRGLYVAWVNHNANNQADVMLAHFNNDGAAVGSTVRVNQQAGVASAWRGDPPSVAVADGAVYVLWTARVESDGKSGTDVYFSVSHDDGKTFGASVKVNDDNVPVTHGMHSLVVANDGHIFVAWLDERNVATPKPSNEAGGHHMETNRELFVSDSNDGGRTFSPNRKVAENACPCCRTALAVAADGTLYVGWRQVLPGDFRHIAVATSTDHAAHFSPPVIVSDDKWVLHGCPVSGPTLSAETNGTLRVVWFAAGQGEDPGLYYSETHDRGRTFSPRASLAEEPVNGSAVLAVENDRAFAIWQGSVGQQAEAKARELGGGGGVVNVATNAELPSGALSNNKLFVVYISRVGDKRSIWLTKVG